MNRNRRYKTGLSEGLICCPYCNLVTRLPPINTKQNTEQNTKKNVQSIVCPRCNAKLHSRIPNSFNKTAALIAAATFMYVPANVLPIMNVTYLGSGDEDTIMEGVVHLLEEGMWPLALIVFIASIVVPILKLLIMTCLLISVKMGSRWRPEQRIRLFHITEFIGRWSMVDIFVLAILVALVQFGNLASVDAGLGALSFATVVILTIFAAHTFDPRLVWDAMEESDSTNDLLNPPVNTEATRLVNRQDREKPHE